MDVLALDFDGVICDSSREVFLVALRTFARLRPATATAHHELVGGTPGTVSGYQFEKDPLFKAFCRLLPFGNRAEDFGVALNALEERGEISDQGSYDRAFCRHDSHWLAEYHDAFYDVRSALKRDSPAVWMSLHTPFERFVGALARRADRRRLALVTAKDRASATTLLEAYGLAQLFPPSMVFDKETGVSKTVHLRQVQAKTGATWPHITFVDDKVNHLQRAAPLGIRCVLAGWGHNTPREHNLARRLGFEVARLDTVEGLLFG